jgi:hypothetical protein
MTERQKVTALSSRSSRSGTGAKWKLVAIAIAAFLLLFFTLSMTLSSLEQEPRLGVVLSTPLVNTLELP